MCAPDCCNAVLGREESQTVGITAADGFGLLAKLFLPSNRR
jgi:hypothetical protein